MKQPAIYIMANKKNGTLYTGVTGNLIQRIWQHKNDTIDGFSKKYQIHLLVYFEIIDNFESAIKREKQIKKFSRKKKLELIESKNPYWQDLYDKII